jgi:nucleotide-binding universal stress UspA family protein
MAATTETPVEAPCRNVLVAFDGSEGSRAALDHGIELARRDLGRLTVVSVRPTTVGVGTVAPTADLFVAVEAVRRQLACEHIALAQKLVPADVPLTTVIRRGHPGREILAQIDDGHHDVVLLGAGRRGVLARARGRFGRFVLKRSRIRALEVAF